MKYILIIAICIQFFIALAEAPSNDQLEERTFIHNVLRTRDRVCLKGFRSASQKGPTCNVYSAIMILYYFRYYKANVRDLKRGADGYMYRYAHFLRKKLHQYDFEYTILTPHNRLKLSNVIKKSIDNGIPIHWIVNLKFSPIAIERNGSFHARVIIGYYHKNGVLTEIMYADSWGKRNLHKRMDINSAFRMTVNTNLIYPKDLDKKVLTKLMASAK